MLEKARSLAAPRLSPAARCGSRYRPGARAGKSGGAGAIKTYLKTIIGEQNYRPDIVDAFVASGREALAFLEKEGAVKYSLRPSHRITIRMSPAPSTSDALEVVEYDGRELGDAFATCALPAGDAAVWRDDGQPRRYSAFSRYAPLAALVGALHPAAAALRPRPGEYPRGTRLAMGNALIARMATTALRKGMSSG
jgi:hypothetical protein